MLTDHYGLSLSTDSTAARDAYVEGVDCLRALYPGAVEAFDRAITADPRFASAHVARARALQSTGDMASAKASLELAAATVADSDARCSSQIRLFNLLFSGQSSAAFDAVRAHLKEWPRDMLALSTTCSQVGLIALSGRVRRDWELASFLDAIAPHYVGDWWFAAHHGMALSETGQQQAARPKIEASIALNPLNATAAHAFAHFCYETGDQEASRRYLRTWLADYPRAGSLHGHLSWHLAICDLEAGDQEAGARLYADSFGADDYAGPALFKIFDATSFLWRSELAGHPRDEERWREIQSYARRTMPQPGLPYGDWHIALADAVAGDEGIVETRAGQMADLVREGRYPAGAMVLTLNEVYAAYERSDFVTVIEKLSPLIVERERLGGSRAQLDLLDFTLMKALFESGRTRDLSELLAKRRPGPVGIPVAGIS